MHAQAAVTIDVQCCIKL